MKSAVIYYSYGGNTHRIADRIAKELGADLFRIDTAVAYDGDYNSVVDQGQREVNRGYCPEIKSLPLNLENYDTVILGTPVWWYTFAPAMHTFLRDNDLSGKTVYPFATNGGWIGHTFEDFAAACKSANVKKGMNIRFEETDLITPQSDIDKWINQIK